LVRRDRLTSSRPGSRKFERSKKVQRGLTVARGGNGNGAKQGGDMRGKARTGKSTPNTLPRRDLRRLGARNKKGVKKALQSVARKIGLGFIGTRRTSKKMRLNTGYPLEGDWETNLRSMRRPTKGVGKTRKRAPA